MSETNERNFVVNFLNPRLDRRQNKDENKGFFSLGTQVLLVLGSKTPMLVLRSAETAHMIEDSAWAAHAATRAVMKSNQAFGKRQLALM